MKTPRFARELLLAALLLLVPPGAAARAQPAPQEDREVPEEAAVPTAGVVVDGNVLFNLRGISSYPAQERARTVAENIVSVVRDRSFKAEELQVVESPAYSEIKAGDRTVLRVFDADARVESVERKLLAQFFLQRIQRAIVEYRNERSFWPLLKGGLVAVLATILTLALVLLVFRLKRWLDGFAERNIRQRVPSLEVRSFKILPAKQIWTVARGALKAASTLAIIALAYLYLHFTLSLFPWTRPFATRLIPYVIDPLATMGRGFLGALPDLLFLVFLVYIVRIALKLLRMFFWSVERGAVPLSGFAPEGAQPTYRLVRVGVVAFAAVIAYPYIPGSASGAFKGVSIFLGVLVSVGGTSVIANVLAGYTMTYRRAFRVGDRVQINDVVGEVTEVRVLVTRLRTRKNEEVVIPNSVILNSQVVNYSALAPTLGLILHATVGIGYEVPWRQVEAMLQLAAERTPGALKDPPPFVLHKALGDFAVTYELNVFCRDARKMVQVQTDLHRNILDVFNEYGVQIMTPAYEGDPEQPKVVPREQWHAAPASNP